ncbi:serine phosphatase RsbU (regulator of sigma subunit) [Streptacidiphilus sp. MAP12-20]|uniref:SpoIIE family protein phosphatase n=1 Tax=Streptacidiphilus sp. MAP12-20 TaxID=3156299 RepID=UPI003512D421
MSGPTGDATGADPLAGLFAHAPVIFASLSGPTHLLEWANEAFFEAVGVGRGPELLGRPTAEALPELVHQGLLALLDSVYHQAGPYVAQSTGVLLGPPGKARLRYFDFSFEPRRDQAGQVVGVAFLAVDVTRQRAAHKLATEQQALLEQIARDAPLAEVLDGMCRAIEKLSPRVLSSVLLVDATGRRLLHGAAPSLPDFYRAAIDGSEIGPQEGSCGTAAYRREMVVVGDIATDPLWTAYRDLARQAGLAACWSSPIISSTGELLGTFAMYHRTPRTLPEADLDLSFVFTRTAALAIERHHAEQARRQAHEREQALSADLARLAHDLQAGLLLAALPMVPGVRLAASYRPAGEGLDIGGDFYDVFPLPQDRWGLVIGDVCGRGARAATTTALVRNTARAVAPLLPTPGAVTEAVNDALLARPDSGENFVTLIYAELRRTREGIAVSMVRAGHPPPLLRRSDGTLTSPSPAGQLLGVSPDPELDVESFVLRSGEGLVLVTDGILEARDATGTFFGEERLVAALRSTGGITDAQRILDAVTDAVDSFNGGVADDDQAALVLIAE